MERLRSSYGYGSYRGRSKLRTFLTVVIVILLVVLLLAVAAFFLLQKYIVYTDDGRARLELPFLQRQEETAPPVSPSADDVVVVTAEPTPEPREEILRAAALPRSALYDGTAADQVAAAGGNAAWFDMKADDGTLGYVSSLPAAISFGSSGANPALNAAITALNGGGLYTVARVSCFRDNLAPRQDNSLAVKTNSGYNWRDAGDIRWLSPTIEGAQDYVAGVCRELAALGFDEIWLDNAAYPTTGHLEYIKAGANYDESQFAQVLDGFYGKVREALKDYPEVKLSLSAGGGVLTGEGDKSGQTTGLLGKYADRIYAPGPESEEVSRQYDRALEGMGLSPARMVFTSLPYVPELTSSYAPMGGALLSAAPTQ